MAKEKKSSIAAEFKEFIAKGNVMDLAVGVIIGGAFQAIVNSLVNDILMPLIGVITGGLDFGSLAVTIGDASINYGAFIQNVVYFLIVAWVIFLVVKLMNRLRRAFEPKKKEESEEK